MRPELQKREWARMLFSITDPEEKEKSRRKTEIIQRAQDKIRDTGL